MGEDVETILGASNLTLADLQGVQARLPVEAVHDFWRAAIHRTADESLGLHMAEHVAPGTFDVVDYLARNCRTIGDAIDKANPFLRLIADDFKLSLDVDDGRAVLACPREVPAPRPIAECSLAVLVFFARQMTGAVLRPLEVHFVHGEPRDTCEYARIFQARIRFGSACDALVFPEHMLELRIKNADPTLGAVLERHARQLLERIPDDASFSRRARRLIAEQLRGGNPSIAQLAHVLHVTPRTVRRRLSEEGVSYQALLDEARENLAVLYLRESELGITEIAHRLGFADSSAFNKAFRRWTGTSVKEYRQEHQ